MWVEQLDDESSFGIGLTHGNRIKGIEPGSAAERAALRTWDLITHCDGVPVAPGDLVEAVAGGTEVTLTIKRPSPSKLQQVCESEMQQASPEWLRAIVAAVEGDCAMLVEALHALHARGDDVRSRRVAVGEAAAVVDSEGEPLSRRAPNLCRGRGQRPIPIARSGGRTRVQQKRGRD